MPMLAERRRKVKWTLNPGRQALWKKEDSSGIKFGRELMEKMGWKVGQGLGVNEQGIKEPLKVAFQNDSKGMGFKDNGNEWIQQQQDFNELLSQLSSSKNVGEEDGKSTTQSLEEKSRSSRARVHYKKFTRGKDLANYSEKDLECILGGKKEQSKQSNEEDDVCEFAEDEDETGLTVNAGSMVDYFAGKLKRKTGALGSDSAEKELTNLEPDVCEGEKSREKSKKKKRKKEDSPDGNELVENVDSSTRNDDAQDNCEENVRKKKSKKRAKLDANLIESSQSDQTDSAALIKRERDKVETECDGGMFDSTECKSSGKKKRKHETELEDGNIKYSENELTGEKKKKKKKKRERADSSCGDEANESSIAVESFTTEAVEESVENGGPVEHSDSERRKEKHKKKKKSRKERKDSQDHEDEYKPKTEENKSIEDQVIDNQESPVGNNVQVVEKNGEVDNSLVDLYKTELLKNIRKEKGSGSNKRINLIKCTNIDKFNGSNLGVLKGYGIVRSGSAS
ncbi:UNVERIFIED_CONTAM: hypothetical protein PYX00_006109 [Menopon gallinae]|uniref:G-patch domain-containing protein n=1 Tax=Menopon gallinae TaxID=328185 RepID=A0AAW2HU16_9NEOP